MKLETIAINSLISVTSGVQSVERWVVAHLGPHLRHLVLQLPHAVGLGHGGGQVVLGAQLLVLQHEV